MYTHFKNTYCTINVGTFTVKVSIIYRPPTSKQNFRNSTFFDEWSKYLYSISITPCNIIITGDLNFHADIKSDVEACRFCSILESHGLNQHVKSVKIVLKGGHTAILSRRKQQSSGIRQFLIPQVQPAISPWTRYYV